MNAINKVWETDKTEIKSTQGDTKTFTRHTINYWSYEQLI